MKKNLEKSLLTLALTAGLLPVCAQAQLKITEVESSEAPATTVLTTKPNTPQDWFELSNFGSSSINITGYTMDDNSDSFALSVPLMGVSSIAPGESVVFFENDGTTLTAQDFENWWGSGLGASVQIGTYGGSGVGLGSGGDAVNIFDSSGNPIDGVVFGTATAGTTFVFDDGATGRSDTGLSLNGVEGAFTSQNGDVGSPGVAPVPEPSTLAMIGLGLAGLIGFRKHSRKF
jgi:hypothetical protein